MDERSARARCWAEVDLDVVLGNYDRAKSMLGAGVTLIPVLKANAYGLGAAQIARTLYARGARLFAVAAVDEALALGRCVPADVLVMGGAGCQARAAIEAGVILTAYSPASAQALSDEAAGLGKVCRVHLKLDTGLHRLGFDPMDDAALARALSLPHLSFEGVFTHLALHGMPSDAAQCALFDRVAARIPECMPHVLDSIGLVRHPDRQYGAVRLGAWLYGVHPRDVQPSEDPLCVRLLTRVAQVRTVRAHSLIGYDDDTPLARDARIATLSCGYADGYPRLAWKGEVSIRGLRARVAGLVCMDQMMVDVSGIPGVREGDEAVLLGDGIGIDEYAAWGNLNRNEALARIAPRVARVYLQSEL